MLTNEEIIFTSNIGGRSVPLLQVAPGAKATDALNKASCLLASANAISLELTESKNPNADCLYGISGLIEIAKALVDSTNRDLT